MFTLLLEKFWSGRRIPRDCVDAAVGRVLNCGRRTLGITRLLCILLFGEGVLERQADPQILAAYSIVQYTVTPLAVILFPSLSSAGCDLPLLGEGVLERRQTLGLLYLLRVF